MRTAFKSKAIFIPLEALCLNETTQRSKISGLSMKQNSIKLTLRPWIWVIQSLSLWCHQATSVLLQWQQVERDVKDLSRTMWKMEQLGVLSFPAVQQDGIMWSFFWRDTSCWPAVSCVLELARIRSALYPLPCGADGCLHHNPRLQFRWLVVSDHGTSTAWNWLEEGGYSVTVFQSFWT